MKRYIYFLIISFLFLFCRESFSKNLKPLIYLDPGHGGADFGACIKNPRVEEKKYALITAHYVKRYLEKLGYRVSLTRSRDFFISLRRRVFLANRSRADIFLSIHYNSSPVKSAHGIEIFFPLDKNRRSYLSKLLAEKVLDRMIFRTKAKRRKLKRKNYFVLRESRMPSILIEGGFLTNEKERNNIRRLDYLQKIAKGIAEGIDRFFKRKKSG